MNAYRIEHTTDEGRTWTSVNTTGAFIRSEDAWDMFIELSVDSRVRLLKDGKVISTSHVDDAQVDPPRCQTCGNIHGDEVRHSGTRPTKVDHAALEAQYAEQVKSYTITDLLDSYARSTVANRFGSHDADLAIVRAEIVSRVTR